MPASGVRQLFLDDPNGVRIELVVSELAAPAASSGALPRIMSDAFSAIMIVAAFVFARVIVGITDASTTRSPSTP